VKMTRGRVIIFALVLFGLGGWLSWQLRGPAQPSAPLEIAGIYLPTPLEVGDFTLQSADGQAFGPTQLQNRWTFMFFGYTFCPDACPLTLSQLNLIEKKLSTENPELHSALGYVLISVDPRRDTLERLAQYTQHFNPRFEGVTGDPAELEKLAKPLGIYYAVPENPDDPENYLVDHSSALVLINPEGRLQALFSAPHDPARIVQDLLAIQQRWSS